MDNYSCCFTFVFFILLSLLIIFGVSLSSSSFVGDGDSNTMFVVLSMTMIIIFMIVTVVCGIACRRSLRESEHSKKRQGALYVVYSLGSTLHPKLLKQSGTDCPICWETLALFKIVTLSCGHVFHKTCIDQHFKMNDPPTCPYCRATPLKFPGPERIVSDVRLVLHDVKDAWRRCSRRPPEDSEPEWV